MIRTKDECSHVVVANMKGGNGEAVQQHFLNPDEFYGKGRLFARTILKPGCSVGMHEHTGDVEAIYFISGTGTVIDNGKEYTVHAGDVNIDGPGDRHEIINTGTEDLVYVAVILYTE